MTTAAAGPPLTLHVLDTAKGVPASGMPVILSERISDGTFQEISSRLTNSDGRSNFLNPGELEAKVYKIRFDTGAYFKSINTKGFYPYAEVVFEIENPNQHYHVPLLLSPYSYSTYRGS